MSVDTIGVLLAQSDKYTIANPLGNAASFYPRIDEMIYHAIVPLVLLQVTDDQNLLWRPVAILSFPRIYRYIPPSPAPKEVEQNA